MKKAVFILLSLCLLFSFAFTEVKKNADNADNPEKEKVCDVDFDFDNEFANETMTQMAIIETPRFFPLIFEASLREKDVGSLFIINNYDYKKTKPNPEYFLPDIRRLSGRHLGASFYI